MTKYRGFSAALLLGALFLTAPAFAGTDLLQSQEDFAAAILNHSTSPYFVRLTVVDDRTGAANTGCIEAPFFVRALMIESGMDEDNASRKVAERTALSNPTRVFHFSKQAAIDNMPLNRPQSREACDFIAKGKRAALADRSGKVVASP